MKKLLATILLFIAFAVSCHAQKDTLNKKVKDTVATGDTPLLSYNDLQLFKDKVLGDIPLKYAEPVINSLMSMIQQRAAEYAAKKKVQAKSNK